jgi:hypothetical protein
MSEAPDSNTIHSVEQAEKHIDEAHQTLEELVREHEKVKAAKASEMKRFNERIGDIESRMEGQLRVLDSLRQRRHEIETQPELPFDKAPADGSGDVVKAQDGTVLAGEEAFTTAGQPLEGEEPEDADVIPLLTAHHEEAGSSVEFMADGMEPAPADDDTLRLDDEEIEMLGKGDVEGAKQLYVLRTGSEDAVADAEIKAWQAAQQPVDPPTEKPMSKRGRGRRSAS